jgi:hypothetical protein
MVPIAKRLLALGLALSLASPVLAQTTPITPSTQNVQPAPTNPPTTGPYGGFNAVAPGSPTGTTATGTPTAPYGGFNAMTPGNPIGTTATGTPSAPYGGVNAVRPGFPAALTAGGIPNRPPGGLGTVPPGSAVATPFGTATAAGTATQPLLTTAQFNQLFGGLNVAVPVNPPPSPTSPQGATFPGAGTVPGATVPGASPFSNPFSLVPIGPGILFPGSSVTNPAITPGTATGVTGYSSNGPGVVPNGGMGTATVPGGTGIPAPTSTPPR